MHLDLIQYALTLPGAAGIGLIVVVLSALAARAWASGMPRHLRSSTVYWPVFQLMLGMSLADGVALALLPILGLSFGRIEVSWTLITLVRQAVFGLVALGLAGFGLLRRPALSDDVAAIRPSAFRIAFRFLVVLQTIILACEIQGLYHEPFRLGTTTIKTALPLSVDGRPLRLLQISDLHVERITRRERAVLAEAARLQPDIIVLTGDYVNLDFRSDPQTWADARSILSQLSAPLGVYAVTGTPSVDIPEAVDAIFNGLDHIRLLRDEVVRLNLPGGGLTILGVSNLDYRRDLAAFERLAAQVSPDEDTLLLYHTPDLAPLAAQSGLVDLYLAGHTHGGQIRVPFYGALVTFSAYGRTFQMGRYALGEMTLYVSRGLGMEGFSMPRARFLCPPELVLVESKVP